MKKKIKTNEELLKEIEKIKTDYNRKIDRILFEYKKKLQDIVDQSRLRKIRDSI